MTNHRIKKTGGNKLKMYKSHCPVRVVPAEEVAGQKAAFDYLLKSLGNASLEELDTILDERDEAPPEPGLSQGTIEKVNAMIARKMGNPD